MRSTRRCSNILLLAMIFIAVFATAMTVLPTMQDSNVAYATDSMFAIEEGMYDLYTDTKTFTYAGNVYNISDYNNNSLLKSGNVSAVIL